MTTESTAYPDIEIYLKKINTENIIKWLNERFEQCEITKQARAITEAEVTYNSQPIPVLIVEKAQDGFTSVLFNSHRTPWASDKECAIEAFSAFDTEARCNAASWKEGDEPDEWLSISEEGEKLMTWHG